MVTVLQSCTPRPELATGSFNPEIFTASLRQVIGHYRSEITVSSVYCDADTFFREATSITYGMKQVMEHVARRLKGDNLVPFLTRLETGFGGGKTHTLIACTHLAMRGDELKELAQETGVINPQYLLPKGSVSVVGIAGDEISVVQSHGDRVVPYTLWAELAKQIGGQELLNQVKAEAMTPAAPGESFFDAVLGQRKVLILIDELAQYLARAEAAHPGMGQQVAAFFMALCNYARNHSGIAIVLTLASSTDAFAGQTRQLSRMISIAAGQVVNQDEAHEIGRRAIDEVQSVLARDATSQTPISSEELSSVLAKRLFTKVDPQAAVEVASVYQQFYQKHQDQLPSRCTRATTGGTSEYSELIRKYYPFHPTLVDFLNKKLATAEDFQGTRGVLRVLAFAVKAIWEQKLDTLAIHTCHLDTTNPDLINEILSKTESGDLRNVLTADIGAVRASGELVTTKSNAEQADLENPHPNRIPMHVFVWRSVFLHSLVGRKQGISSNLFGLVQEEARLENTQPGLPPSQIDTALLELANKAFYLRHQDGKYYASLDPSINKALAQIRDGVTDFEIEKVLTSASNKVVSSNVATFQVHYEVSHPEHLPDNQSKPMLGIVNLFAGNIIPDDFVLFEKQGVPRVKQNLVFLLVPETVQSKPKNNAPQSLFQDSTKETFLRDLKAVARDVIAMRKLNKSPLEYSISPKHLQDDGPDGFQARIAERENALNTRVTQTYKNLWFPSATGQVVCKEIQSAGGEGGVAVINQIRKTLIEEQELITDSQINTALLKQLVPMFFGSQSICKIETLRENFVTLRNWPVLDSHQVLDQIIRKGFQQGLWFVYRFDKPDANRPSEFYTRESDSNGIPLHVDLTQKGYGLVTPQGAKQREWTATTVVTPETIRLWVKSEINNLSEPRTLVQVKEEVTQKHGPVSFKDISNAVVELTRDLKVVANASTGTNSEIKYGDSAMMYVPSETDLIAPVAVGNELGWIKVKTPIVRLEGDTGRQILFEGLLKRLPSLYTRGAKSQIDRLRISHLEFDQKTIVNLDFTCLNSSEIQKLQPIFDTLALYGKPGSDTDVELTIMRPVEGCLLIKEIRGDNAKKSD